MANQLYTKAKEKLLSAGINWVGDAIKVALVDSASYAPNLDTDEFLSAIAPPAIIATSPALTNKTVTGGAADADDVTIDNIAGASFEYLVVYKDTGNAGTSPLVCLIDSATNLPFTPNSGSLTVQWDAGTNKIFRLN